MKRLLQPLRDSRAADRASRRRRGATMVETAIVLWVFLVLILGMLELALAIFRYHVVSQGARQLARQAIVRGELAAELTTWGPTAYTATASSTDAIATGIKPYLAGLDPAQTTISLEWPEGNALERPVRATITTTHEAFLTVPFGGDNWTLTGVSSMPIAH